ncbi:hypothetical protein [Lactobacillus sp. UCMA15818]|uniref:hypothetical protein n=1 Tax=Lactobacillaceae TaxID=33958 RepID=UPI0025B27A51|nr:hypothetical protein [Lactobacillus sp. UCMA15818]MDN2452896.1 hypothetical protein [Lactobacillus sp. UCMA15818]
MRSWIKISIIIVILDLLIVFGVYHWYEKLIWKTPYYSSTQDIELVSDDQQVQRLTSQQYHGFIRLTHRAIKRQLDGYNFEDLHGYNIEIWKTKQPHVYYINYVCGTDFLVQRFSTVMSIRIKEPTLRGNPHFKIVKFISHLPR